MRTRAPSVDAGFGSSVRAPRIVAFWLHLSQPCCTFEQVINPLSGGCFGDPQFSLSLECPHLRDECSEREERSDDQRSA